MSMEKFPGLGFDSDALEDWEIKDRENTRLIELGAKMNHRGIWKDYIPTPEEKAEWEKIQKEKVEKK